MRTLALALFILTLSPLVRGEVVLHVLDVGYGQSIHLQSNFRNYLFDTGVEENSSKILEHLADQAVTRLDAIFISHAHPDHAGGLLKIVKQMKTEAVYWNEHFPPEEEFIETLEKLKAFTAIKKMDHGQSTPLSSEVILTALGSGLETPHINDDSLVFFLKTPKKKILIGSGAERERQKDLAQREKKKLKKVSLLIWPHHGDTLEESFLSTFKKVEFCVVSVGENNYGLPKPTLEAQSEILCRQTYRTDQNGPRSFSIGRKILPLIKKN